MANEPKAHSQLFSIKKIRVLMGIANISAVNKESCRGEMFLVEIMPLSPKGEFTQIYDYWNLFHFLLPFRGWGFHNSNL